MAFIADADAQSVLDKFLGLEDSHVAQTAFGNAMKPTNDLLMDSDARIGYTSALWATSTPTDAARVNVYTKLARNDVKALVIAPAHTLILRDKKGRSATVLQPPAGGSHAPHVMWRLDMVSDVKRMVPHIKHALDSVAEAPSTTMRSTTITMTCAQIFTPGVLRMFKGHMARSGRARVNLSILLDGDADAHTLKMAFVNGLGETKTDYPVDFTIVLDSTQLFSKYGHDHRTCANALGEYMEHVSRLPVDTVLFLPNDDAAVAEVASYLPEVLLWDRLSILGRDVGSCATLRNATAMMLILSGDLVGKREARNFYTHILKEIVPLMREWAQDTREMMIDTQREFAEKRRAALRKVAPSNHSDDDSDDDDVRGLDSASDDDDEKDEPLGKLQQKEMQLLIAAFNRLDLDPDGTKAAAVYRHAKRYTLVMAGSKNGGGTKNRNEKKSGGTSGRSRSSNNAAIRACIMATFGRYA